MSTQAVTAAKAQDRERVVSAIVLAFVEDPIARWSWPEPHTYLTCFTEFTNVFGGKAFDHNTAHSVAEFSGGALWLPPGVQPDEKALVALMERSIDPKRLEAVFTLFEKMGGYHPSEPHWYLPLIGVEPTKQGRGYGAALLGHALEHIDREGRIAYLESTNPANIPLYKRHGFEVIATIQVGDSPPLYPMIRDQRLCQ
jgi:ribosomal protein S18 acetylase RimI-like enzyme